jgi:hypothetical protein
MVFNLNTSIKIYESLLLYINIKIKLVLDMYKEREKRSMLTIRYLNNVDNKASIFSVESQKTYRKFSFFLRIILFKPVNIKVMRFYNRS